MVLKWKNKNALLGGEVMTKRDDIVNGNMTDKKPLAYAITKGNKKAAKITKNGILTAKKADSLEITAYSDKKKKDVITTVTVVIKDTKVPTKDVISYMDDKCG